MRDLRYWVGMGVLLLLPAACFSQNLSLADSLNRRGMAYYDSGNYRQAEFYLREAFQMYKKRATPAVWLSPGIDYAEILVDRSRYDRALALFKRLKKVAVTQNNIQARARIENDLGWTYNKIGQSKLALKHLQNAIPLAKKAQDTLRLGYANDNIGAIYRSLGKYEASLEYHKKALPFYQKLRKQKSIAINLNNIGVSYEKMSLYNKAIEYYEKSLAIKKKLGNADLLATATGNIGALYKQLGNFDQALVYYQQSLEYARTAGTPVKTAQTLNNIGVLYCEFGQPEQGLAYYRQSLQLKKQYANAASLAVTYSNIAGRYLQNGQLEEALPYYQQALKLRKQTGNPRAVAVSLLALARLEKNRAQFARSEKYIARARVIADSTHDRSLQLKTRSLLGSVAFDQGRYGRARSDFKEALSYGEALEGSVRLSPLINLAYTYNELGSDSTIYYGRQAIHIIEAQRSQTGSLSEFKSGYFKQHVDFYKAMAAWQLKFKHDVPGAYHYGQLAKTRTLNDELAAAAQRIDESLPEKVRIERRRQQKEISHLYTERKHTKDEQKVAALKKKIRHKELSYASFENRLQKKYPNYKRLKSPEPVSLQQVRDMCDEKTAVLEYAVTDHYLLVFLISQQTVRAKRFLLHSNRVGGVSNLAVQVNRFRQAMLAKAPEDSLALLSEPIYQKLLAPFKDQIARDKNLIIVPDSYLAYLPFGALKNGSNYLVSKYNIKYEPSMTGFSYVKSPDHRAAPNLLAIGNSAGQRSDRATPLLPSVEVEIKSIARLFDHAKTLKKKQVTEAAVKKMLAGPYSYIHIAAHSEIDEQNSFLSGIVLNRGHKVEHLGDDGYLRSSEIYRLNMSANLVVLSACSSGMGELVHGEGLLGLQRSFLNAGASSVMVTLWNVYDRSTARFMKHFYRTLLNPQQNEWSGWWSGFLRMIGWDDSIPFGDTAAALRTTQLWMLHSAEYHHPVYWAPFVVLGR